MTDASVLLWGREIAAVSWLEDRQVAVFQYAPEFVTSRIEVAPIMMPLREAPYSFPELPREAFKGLPGLLADSLPDRYGNALIDAWLASRGRTPDSFNPVERLCYIGTRGMGALEFEPSVKGPGGTSAALDVAGLVKLANRVLDERCALAGNDEQGLHDILRVGSSAGGARAKGIVAWNRASGEFRSGQVPHGQGFSYWLIKFDGISGNRDKELADPRGYGLIEYAYHLMARQAGITMAECRLHREGGRVHFMTRRFDRDDHGRKLHMQSLSALMHYDFNLPDAYSYEQAILAMRRIGMSNRDIEQQFLRAVFNILARNHDDHVKNIAYLMDQDGNWRLSPAFDVVYAFNPDGPWTRQHQMSVNGKRDGFEIDDLLALAKSSGIKARNARRLVAETQRAVDDWPRFAAEAGVSAETASRIAATHRKLV